MNKIGIWILEAVKANDERQSFKRGLKKKREKSDFCQPKNATVRGVEKPWTLGGCGPVMFGL